MDRANPQNLGGQQIKTQNLKLCGNHFEPLSFYHISSDNFLCPDCIYEKKVSMDDVRRTQSICEQEFKQWDMMRSDFQIIDQFSNDFTDPNSILPKIFNLGPLGQGQPQSQDRYGRPIQDNAGAAANEHLNGVQQNFTKILKQIEKLKKKFQEDHTIISNLRQTEIDPSTLMLKEASRVNLQLEIVEINEEIREFQTSLQNLIEFDPFYLEREIKQLKTVGTFSQQCTVNAHLLNKINTIANSLSKQIDEVRRSSGVPSRPIAQASNQAQYSNGPTLEQFIMLKNELEKSKIKEAEMKNEIENLKYKLSIVMKSMNENGLLGIQMSSQSQSNQSSSKQNQQEQQNRYNNEDQNAQKYQKSNTNSNSEQSSLQDQRSSSQGMVQELLARQHNAQKRQQLEGLSEKQQKAYIELQEMGFQKEKLLEKIKKFDGDQQKIIEDLDLSSFQ
ncbi:UNKNOWN [Stylonychia lemnae]|uniref:UBA domain-containing protein n=1 Tax=Stylonychia lemnae TaxID=5949 RepID=A0A078AKJ8_STYLE|nr:UNKNOWN [Stylonychia lemnae]|eukprot:CDW82880.1 UNKNOWN [Stylonychia lemnae]